MGSKLAEIGSTLDVSQDDLREIRRQKRRDRLVVIGQILAPIASAVLGVIAAEEAYPYTPRNTGGYPLATATLAVATQGKTFFPRRSWAGSILMSVILFATMFVSVALFNTPATDEPVTLYGVYSQRGRPCHTQ